MYKKEEKKEFPSLDAHIQIMQKITLKYCNQKTESKFLKAFSTYVRYYSRAVC